MIVKIVQTRLKHFKLAIVGAVQVCPENALNINFEANSYTLENNNVLFCSSSERIVITACAALHAMLSA